jgi:hypothetical protein
MTEPVSLIARSVGQRLLLAGALVAALWLLVLWAGTGA